MRIRLKKYFLTLIMLTVMVFVTFLQFQNIYISNISEKVKGVAVYIIEKKADKPIKAEAIVNKEKTSEALYIRCNGFF